MSRCNYCMKEYDEKNSQCPYCDHHKETIEPFQLPIETVLNERFQIGMVLGYGGFGVTYIAWDILLEKKVAIKEYMPMGLASRIQNQKHLTIYSNNKKELFEKGKENFAKEAKKLALFNDEDGIVSVYHCFEENNTAYFVMEYVEGETVAQKVEREGAMSSQQVKAIMLPLLLSLKEVHKKGVIHRDIAPDNIYLTKDGKVKLLDFGAAKSMISDSLTSQSISMIIKKGYAPEEQYKYDCPIGTYSDMYSIAATMYYMLTKVVPKDAMERSDHEQLIAPCDLVDYVDRNLNNAIQNAMILDYKQRTQNAEQFYQEITNRKKTKIKKVKERDDLYSIPSKLKIVFSMTASVAVLLCVFMVFNLFSDNLLQMGLYKVIASEQTYAPGFLNKDVEVAYEEAKKANVQLVVTEKIDDEHLKAGMVLKQSVDPGQVLAKNGVIQLSVARGTQRILVDNVCYMDLEKAQEKLEKAGFRVTLKYEENTIYKNNIVISQSVDAGKSSFKGDEIVLTISVNNINKQCEPIDINGKTLKSVLKQTKDKAYVEVKEYQESNQKAGIILSSSIKDQYIEVCVSTKEKGSVLQDVELMNKEDAIHRLSDMDVDLEEEYSDFVKEGVIIKQKQKPGKVVKKDETINLVVSKGKYDDDLVIDSIQDKITKEWTNWTTETFLVNNDAYEVEEKTQYAYYACTHKENTFDEEIDGFQIIDKKDSGKLSNYTEWSNYISGKALKDNELVDYSETEILYRYHNYVCNTPNCQRHSYSFPGYMCLCGQLCNTYLEKLVWNSPLKDHVLFEGNMVANNQHYYGVHWYGNITDDWFYDPGRLEADYRFKKRERYPLFNYTYKSDQLSEWQDNKITSNKDMIVVNRKIYRYRLK